MDEKIREIEEIKEYVRHLKVLCPTTLEVQYFERLFSHISILEGKVREAEIERERLSKELIEERMKIVELCDAVEKHEAFKRTHEKVVSLEDEELYKTRLETNIRLINELKENKNDEEMKQIGQHYEIEQQYQPNQWTTLWQHKKYDKAKEELKVCGGAPNYRIVKVIRYLLKEVMP